MESSYRSLKQIFDTLLAFVGLILLSPLFIVIAVMIKLDSRGPVLFRQKRVGKAGRIFEIYKFRTMDVNNNIHDRKSQDMRTRVGKILRKTSLDELPQLLNIVKGEMAFVGPRPWVTDYALYMNATERGRYTVLPGITGLAQVNGRNALSISDKISYDLQYIENQSLKTDLEIIFATLKSFLPHPAIATTVDAGKDHIYSEIDQLKYRRLGV